MRYSVLPVAMLLVCGAFSGAAAIGPERLIGPAERFDPGGAAGDRTALAVIRAPAFLALEERPEVMFGRLQTDGSFDGDGTLYIRSRRFGFGTESIHFEGEESARRYTVSLASRYDPRTAIGVTYTFYTSDDADMGDLSSIDLSYGVRTSGRMAFLFAARNLGRAAFRDERIDRFYETEVSILVAGGRGGLYIRGRMSENTSPRDAAFFAGASFAAGRTLLFRARVDDEGDVAAGVELLLRRFALGFSWLSGGEGGPGGLSYFRMFAFR